MSLIQGRKSIRDRVEIMAEDSPKVRVDMRDAQKNTRAVERIDTAPRTLIDRGTARPAGHNGATAKEMTQIGDTDLLGMTTMKEIDFETIVVAGRTLDLRRRHAHDLAAKLIGASDRPEGAHGHRHVAQTPT